RVTQALAKEGFGVLSDIDVSATLKKKLGLDMPAYRILGACNPQFAHRALEAEPQIGALLPCNVVVRKDGARTLVEMMDPLAVMRLVGKPEVAKIAREVRALLDRVLAAV
ncbi:MAG: ABC transporter ATP-binding protein, partial [Betaproteobacteria bacterium RIFCSPLOWO2_02_FULL_65_24]